MCEWTEWDTSVSPSHSHEGAGLQSPQRGRDAQAGTHFTVPQAPAQTPVTPVTRLNPLSFTLTSPSTLPLLSLPPVSNTPPQETWMRQGWLCNAPQVLSCPKFLVPLLPSWPGALACSGPHCSWASLQNTPHSRPTQWGREAPGPGCRCPHPSSQAFMAGRHHYFSFIGEKTKARKD